MRTQTLKIRHVLCLSLVFNFTNISAQPFEVESTADTREALWVTIYNESLALVNETRLLDLQQGLNLVALKDVSAKIRAETTQLSPLTGEAFQLREQNFDYDLLSPQAMLNKAVGQEITVIHTNPVTGEEIREEATVLANNNGVILKYADRIETGINGRFAFKTIPDNLRESPTLSMQINSPNAGTRKVQLSYLTQGFSWQADYVAILADDEKTLDLSGWVTLSNQSGTAFNQANVQLVAGDVNQARPQEESMIRKRNLNVQYSSRVEPVMTTEAFADYHLYQLPHPTTLANNQTKQVALLSTYKVPVEKEYRFTSPNHYFFSSYREGSDANIKAHIYLHLENKQENNLGMPLPKGIFRAYKNNTQGQALFVGEDRMAHIAKNERFNVYLGEAFDVSMVHTQTEYKQYGKMSESSHKILFNNAKEIPVTVHYNGKFAANWEVSKNSAPFTEKDSQTALWEIHIPANEKITLEYTVKTWFD